MVVLGNITGLLAFRPGLADDLGLGSAKAGIVARTRKVLLEQRRASLSRRS